MNDRGKVLTLAIIGCGAVARKHLKAARYHQNNRRTIQLVAAVDNRPGVPEKMLSAAGFSDSEIRGIRIFTDYQRMLEDIRPDLVAITTPSGSHAAIGLAALDAGAHVLIEKPLTLSLSEADAILTKAKEKKLKVSVGHIYRFFPMVAAIQADIAAGRYGRVLYGDVKVRWGHDQQYYDQAAWRGTWKQDGGALMNQSVHALDLMTWLLDQPVRFATGQIFRQTHVMEAEDLGFAILELDHQVQCLVEGTTTTDPARPEASFFVRLTGGEIRGGILAGKARIQVLDAKGHDQTGRYLRQQLLHILRTKGLGGLGQLGNPHSALLGDLIEAIHQDREPLASGQSGRDALETVLAIYQSAWTNTRVSLPVQQFELQMMQNFFDHT